MSYITLKIVRSDGQIMTINDTQWGITGLSGFDKPEIEVFTQKAAIGDGDLVTGKRVGSRPLGIDLKAKSVALNEVLRRATTSYFISAYTYDVYVYRYGDPRYAASCELESIEIPTEQLTVPISAKIQLLCPEGYLLSEDSFAQDIAGIEPRAGYPYIAYAPYGRIYGIYTYAETVELVNDGDAEAYCQAVFTASGDVTNPKLLCGDGYVRVITDMGSGDVLIIDGKSKRVTLNGANVSNLVDRSSSFDGIIFAVGTNTIGFTADIGSNVLSVYVYYNKRYLGV